MKKNILFILAFFLCIPVFAQKYGYVDTEYILNNIPAYKTAQDQLNETAKTFQLEVDNAYADVDKLMRDYESEKVILSDELKRKREDAINTKDKAARLLQMKYFGKEGELFKKRQELVKPIQDQIYNAIKEISSEENFAFIFDIAAGPVILYCDPKLDKSKTVLDKLGYKNK